MGGVRRSLAAVAAAVAALVAVAGAGAGHGPKPPGHGPKPPGLAFLGQAIVPTGTTFAGTTIGGLSSITYDASRGVFYSLSDDQSQFNPARFYTLRLNLSDGHLDNGDVSFTGVTTLQAPGGGPYAPFSLDPEGLTLDEGRRADRDLGGDRRRAGSRRSCGATRSTGRSSATCRSRTRSCRRARRTACARTSRSRRPPSRRDGATSTSGWRARSPRTARRRRSRTGARRGSSATTSQSGRLERQYVYLTDPIAEPPVPPTQFSVSGLVELLPFDDEHMLAMERSFSVGAPGTGNTIKLYYGRVPRGDERERRSIASRAQEAPDGREDAAARPATLGIPLDNVEGMTLGPKLPDGRQSLVLVSDNNFAASQFTQFLLFALD